MLPVAPNPLLDGERMAAPANRLMGASSAGPAPAAPNQNAPQYERLIEAAQGTGFLVSRLAELIAADPHPSRSEVLGLITDAVAKNLISPQAAAGYAGSIPSGAKEVRGWLQQHFESATQNQLQLAHLIASYGGQMPSGGGANGQ